MCLRGGRQRVSRAVQSTTCPGVVADHVTDSRSPLAADAFWLGGRVWIRLFREGRGEGYELVYAILVARVKRRRPQRNGRSSPVCVCVWVCVSVLGVIDVPKVSQSEW